LGEGAIQVDPAAGDPIKVWDNMELVKLIHAWRPHSPYEITAIYRKTGGDKSIQPSWLAEPKVIGTGFMTPRRFTCKYLPEMFRKLFWEK
jgi:hypothetical protein